MRQIAPLIAIACLAAPTLASDVVHDRNEGISRYRIPLAIGTDGTRPDLNIEASLYRTIVHHDPDRTPLDILSSYWQTMMQDGYREIFRCHDRECGGIAFRRSISVAPFPDMFVSLGDYHYLVGTRDQDDHVVLLASRTRNTGFIQIDRLGTRTTTTPVPTAALSSPFIARLTRDGHSVIDGLIFASGSGQLVESDYPVLAELALWMQNNPDMAIALVGHTDTAGSLEGNQELSVLRARAVLSYLSDKYAIDRDRITVHGIGYLAPLTTNDTEEGRKTNRRVEVVPIRIR